MKVRLIYYLKRTIKGTYDYLDSGTGNESDLSVIGVIRRWANRDGSGMQVIFSKDDKVGGVMYFDHD